MSDVVIRVENLCKEYRLGKIGHGTLYRDLQSGWARFLGREDPNTEIGSVNTEQLNSANDRFWALKDISFDVGRGEIVGIIGRNGAGKSTLLKIISRVTAPTSGNIKIKGRVASLLEVGTGFHPELSGRENIFLNGAILGMQKREIEQKFDEIVSFSEIDKFIDTPVKRYSSGMYVRLAFAVAAHLEPEILVVDEVLAVGDIQFQKKCIGKMGDVAKAGRTVLFVSHNMAAIANLCKNTILLNNGKIIGYGETNEMVQKYLNLSERSECVPLSQRRDRIGDGRLQFIDTWIENASGEKNATILSGDAVKIVAVYEIKTGITISNISIGFAISNGYFQLTDLGSEIAGFEFPKIIPKKGKIECLLPKIPLNYGTYYYNLIARSNNGIEDWMQKAGSFTVEASDYYGTGKMVDPEQGSFLFDQKWTISSLET